MYPFPPKTRLPFRLWKMDSYHWATREIPEIPLFFFHHLFICLWLRWVFIAAPGAFSSFGERGLLWLQCVGSASQWLLLLQSTSPVHRLRSCGAQAGLLCSMWDLPGPGIEPASPALVGRFLTTEPPGKPLMPICRRTCVRSCFSRVQLFVTHWTTAH